LGGLGGLLGAGSSRSNEAQGTEVVGGCRLVAFLLVGIVNGDITLSQGARDGPRAALFRVDWAGSALGV